MKKAAQFIRVNINYQNKSKISIYKGISGIQKKSLKPKLFISDCPKNMISAIDFGKSGICFFQNMVENKIKCLEDSLLMLSILTWSFKKKTIRLS